jgi:hypothetical protein
MDVSRSFWRLLGFALIWLLTTGQTHSGTIDPNTPDAKYLEFGNKFPWVVLLRAECLTIPAGVEVPPGKCVVQYGSAVVIRPNWIITAAHVIADAKNHRIIMGDTEIPLKTVIRHPEFEAARMGYFDLALGYTEHDFGFDFYCPLYTEQDELNHPVTIAGYGKTGTFLTGGREIDNKRRAGQSRVTGIENNVLICQPRQTNKFPLEFLITPGDSGGGLFIGNRLAGVNSFLLAADGKPDGTYTDEGAHTRISLYADWIEKEIARYAATIAAAEKSHPVVFEKQVVADAD